MLNRNKESVTQLHCPEDKLLFQGPVLLSQVPVGLEVSVPRTGVGAIRVTGATGDTWQGSSTHQQHHSRIPGGTRGMSGGVPVLLSNPETHGFPRGGSCWASAARGSTHLPEKAMPWLQVLDHHCQLTDGCSDTTAMAGLGNHLSSQQEAWHSSFQIPGETQF